MLIMTSAVSEGIVILLGPKTRFCVLEGKLLAAEDKQSTNWPL